MSEQTPTPGPFEAVLDVRWSDQDRYGHVNNVRALTLTEEARVRALTAWGETRRDVHRVVRAMTTEYEAPLHYGPELTARVWVTEIGRSSYTLRHELWQEGRCCVRCDAVMVHIDAETSRPLPHDDDVRARLEAARRPT